VFCKENSTLYSKRYWERCVLHSSYGSRDVSCKEQMAVVLRYVDKCQRVREKFVGIEHVRETTSASLQSSIGNLSTKLNLSLKQCRGQGYDCTSNMRGELNGLQSLIIKENKSAYYIHCFSHKTIS
jgi:hypothetical protein